MRVGLTPVHLCGTVGFVRWRVCPIIPAHKSESAPALLWRLVPGRRPGEDGGVSLLLLIVLVLLILVLAGGGVGYRGGMYRRRGLGLGGVLLIILLVLLLVGAI